MGKGYLLRASTKVTRWLLLGALGLSSCRCGTLEQDVLPETVSFIAGRAVERVDEPPFSYLKLTSDMGQVWVAIPVGARSVGDKVKVTGCVAVHNLKVRAAGGVLPRVYLGSLREQ
jgi:hypothetical protein